MCGLYFYLSVNVSTPPPLMSPEEPIMGTIGEAVNVDILTNLNY